jgi:hypothetical protein
MATFFGELFSARDEQGNRKVRIATAFPKDDVIVTCDPPVHIEQRKFYVDKLRASRAEQDLPEMTDDEYFNIMATQAVDLVVDKDSIMIRPDPSQVNLAILTDELLQNVGCCLKNQIRFLYAKLGPVRDALKRRGELWRVFQPPIAVESVIQTIREALTAINCERIYFYSPISGSRILTYDNFRRLGALPNEQLQAQLVEIAKYSVLHNRLGRAEVDFFKGSIPAVDSPAKPPLGKFGAEGFREVIEMPLSGIRQEFERLRRLFAASVPEEYRTDDVNDDPWRCGMFLTLTSRADDPPLDVADINMDPQFSMRVQWLPGGRIDDGELILDPMLEDLIDQDGRPISSVVPALIFNLVQEYGSLEYLNLGRVAPSSSHNELRPGRREVYIAQLKQRHSEKEVVQIIRMQKWGVAERLNDMENLESAMEGAEEYAEYILYRLLACRQLRMNLPYRLTPRKVREPYTGTNAEYRNRDKPIWTPYFQREYIEGVATDKLPRRKMANPAYAARYAYLMGQAAATNMVLGRAELENKVVKEAVFDVGDEIVLEDSLGQPQALAVTDHVGTFVDFTRPLESRAREYAKPIVKWFHVVVNFNEFTEAYLAGLGERLNRMKDDYSRHTRGFDKLFKHLPQNPESLADRWKKILVRLRATNTQDVCASIRQCIERDSAELGPRNTRFL